MGKKHFTHGRLKVFMTIILAVILIVLVVVCAKKIKLAQNEKNIIGTWKNSSSENSGSLPCLLSLFPCSAFSIPSLFKKAVNVSTYHAFF